MISTMYPIYTFPFLNGCTVMDIAKHFVLWPLASFGRNTSKRFFVVFQNPDNLIFCSLILMNDFFNGDGEGIFNSTP